MTPARGRVRDDTASATTANFDRHHSRASASSPTVLPSAAQRSPQLRAPAAATSNVRIAGSSFDDRSRSGHQAVCVRKKRLSVLRDAPAGPNLAPEAVAGSAAPVARPVSRSLSASADALLLYLGCSV